MECDRPACVTDAKFKLLRQMGDPHLKVFNPSTRRYDIGKASKTETKDTRNSKTRCGGCDFSVKDSLSEKMKNAALRKSPLPGDARRLCFRSCYKAALKKAKDNLRDGNEKMNNETREKGEKEKRGEAEEKRGKGEKEKRGDDSS